MDVPPVYESRPGRIALARFARHGGPDLRHLRNVSAVSLPPWYPLTVEQFQGHDLYSTPPSLPEVVPATAPPRKERLSAYDRNLEQHLADHNIHICQAPHLDQGPLPANLASINTRLDRKVLGVMPGRFSESDYAKFQAASRKQDPHIMRTLLPFLIGNAALPQENYLPFDNFEPLTKPINHVPAPAYWMGANPNSIQPWVLKDLSYLIVPTKDPEAPMLPTFFLQARGRPAKPDEEKRMAGLNGAYGARGILALQNYGREETVYDERAWVFSAVYNMDVLTLYAHHVTAPEEAGGRPRYHMTRLRTYELTMGRERFLEAARALRNAMDLAWANRATFILDANEVGCPGSEESDSSE